MLQRAASNAYSWWWASHIRTKQSKWLEQNLQDMEEKVETVLKLISEDGDSFAKRAEMYYKKRPELINFVEESYRAYRALAERYDHISTELQNANNTIATVFPERVQFAMDEDDENGSPRVEKFPHAPKANIPKVPNLPSKNLKGLLISATKKLQAKKTSKGAHTGSTIVKSGLNKSEAIDEIDKLQKEILSMQTEKEFVKCSYEHGIAKYWEIEEQIKEKHNKICSLQDEFSVGSIIEDDEARTLMAAAALKSCQESLSLLQDKHEKSADEAKNEQKRFEDAWKKLHSLKSELLPNQLQQEKYEPTNDGEILFKNFDQEHDIHAQEKQKLEAVQEKFKEYLEVDESNASVTVTEMAEKIDELVNKVINLETAVLSQTAFITSLRTETDELQAQITSLENDEANLINGSDGMSSKLREMEEKLHHIQDINRNVENQNDNLQINFSQAQCSLDQLTGKLHSVKPDEEPETPVLSGNENGSQLEQLHSVKPDEEPETPVLTGNENGSQLEQLHSVKPDGEPETSVLSETENVSQLDQPTGKLHSVKPNEEPEALVLSENWNGSLAEDGTQLEVSVSLPNNHDGQSSPLDHEDGLEIKEKVTEDSEENVSISLNKQEDEEENDPEKQDSLQIDDDFNGDGQEHKAEKEDEPNWQMLFMNGLEDREKMLLSQYTTSLRNCKDKKKQLDEKDVQLKELRNVNGLKDEEIQSLRQKLSFLVTTMADNPDLKELKDSYHHPTLNLLDSEELEPITRSKEDEKDTKISAIEEKFRTKIDEVLENNLDFWLNFSSSFHQVQKFETSVQDLQAEIYKLEGKKLKKKQEGSTSSSLKSDARPLYKHLREIETEITLWLEQNALLKDELQSRVTSLSNIQEDISQALKVGCEDEEAKFNSYQAAKFQGEVLNMKQENAKVAEELQASLDHASALQVDIQRTLTKLDLDFELSGIKNHHQNFKHSISRTRIPLRSFLFGVKQKNKRANIFASMHPALLRKHNSEKKDEHTL